MRPEQYPPVYILLLLLSFSCSDPSSINTTPKPERHPCNTDYNGNDFPAPTVSYRDDILPLFRKHGCTSTYCHGGGNTYSVLSAVRALGPGDEAGNEHKCVVVRGNPEESYLIHKLEGRSDITGLPMPLGGESLSASEMDLVRRWIYEGARDN